MTITVQALQADGTWAVRNAFVTENAKVISGAMKASDLEAQARRVMGQWQSTMQESKQLRVHNSANDAKPARRKIYGELNVSQAELETAQSLSDGDGPLAEAAYQLVRYCRGQIFHRERAEEALSLIRAEAVAA